MQNTFTQHTNAQFVEDLCNYVNNNAGNFECSEAQQFMQQLATQNVIVTRIEHSAFPVLVYMHNDKFVAWYDEELQYGHIA